MRGDRRAEAPIVFLLRIGVGGLWLYDGLIFHLFARWLGVSATAGWPGLAAWLGLDLPPVVQGRALGALEVALGALLLAGVLVRTAAAVQCLLLLLLTLDVALAAPAALLRPLGPLSRNLVLLGACLGLAVAGGDAARQERRLALALRAGLGLMWLHEGLAVKWLLASPLEAQVWAQVGLVAASEAPAFVRSLGLVQAALAVAVLVGLSVRRLAVLQVCLLGGALVLFGAAAPEDLVRTPGGLSRHLAMVGCALLLYQTGGGALALDTRLARSGTWRNLRLLAVLQAAWLLKTAMLTVYRLQVPAAAAEVAHVLQKIERDDRHHADDLLALLQRRGGRRLPVGRAVAAVAWLIGCLTVIAGPRAFLGVDVWAKDRGITLYARAGRLLPPEEGIAARALQAMQGREAAHRQLLEAARRRRGRGGR